MLSQNKNNSNIDFNSLIEGLEELNTEANLSKDLGENAQKCLNSLKKLRIARDFSKIDEEIFKLALNKIDSKQSDYFTELLYLETKRLKFKEESAKCLQNQKTIKIQMTNS